jgi:hypothetical protein
MIIAHGHTEMLEPVETSRDADAPRTAGDASSSLPRNLEDDAPVFAGLRAAILAAIAFWTLVFLVWHIV